MALMPQLVQTLKSESSVAPGRSLSSGRPKAGPGGRGRLVGGVPALHGALELGRQVCRPVAGEPGAFDEPAAQRRRGLLVLAGDPRNEVSGGLFADGAADPGEHRRPFAFRLQRSTARPDDPLAPPEILEGMAFVRLGERREAQVLPSFLRQRRSSPGSRPRAGSRAAGA